MPKGPKGEKRPADANQLAKMIADLATGEAEDTKETILTKRAIKGGKKGGPARAKTLTPTQRSEIASAAAAARWKKSD